MKNLFDIHPLTYFVLLSVLLAGYFNYFLIISIILIVHDIGHIIFILLFGYKIEKIQVLPFGSIINTNINPNASSIKILVISLAGVLMQLLLYLIMPFFLSNISYPIFIKYNALLIFFNLLPIIPLDGSKIVGAILESFMSYKMAIKLVNLISIIGVISFFIYLSFHALNSFLIISFLFYKTYESIKNHLYFFNHFLLDRHLNKHDFKKIKYVLSVKNIHKNKYNFVKNKSEDKALNSYFG